MDLLSGLPYMTGVTTRQINGENPTGEKGGGCRWVPDPSDPNLPHSRSAERLGKGWKVHPFVQVEAGQTITLGEIDGPGVINELFLTSDARNFSELVLRIYWDGEEAPSVEAPIGAFYCMGFDRFPHNVFSLPVTVAPKRGMSCYWQMPFRRHARLTLTNDGEQKVGIVAFRILYKLMPVEENAAYFHAQYRRSMTTKAYPEHVILDGVKGEGLYVGTYLAYNILESEWWGEGEVKFYIDGDTDQPTIVDNGTEDYFGGAWNFGSFNPVDPDSREEAYCSPFLGLPLAVTENRHGPRKFGLYRWHILDSIGFQKDLKVTVQALGWYPNQRYRPMTDDIASVAYWYQREPHAPFPQLPSVEERWDR